MERASYNNKRLQGQQTFVLPFEFFIDKSNCICNSEQEILKIYLYLKES